jgi:hypothetical protein
MIRKEIDQVRLSPEASQKPLRHLERMQSAGGRMFQNAARLICQARGKCNMLPGDKHRGILRRWAEKAGLVLGKYV